MNHETSINDHKWRYHTCISIISPSYLIIHQQNLSNLRKLLSDYVFYIPIITRRKGGNRYKYQRYHPYSQKHSSLHRTGCFTPVQWHITSHNPTYIPLQAGPTVPRVGGEPPTRCPMLRPLGPPLHRWVPGWIKSIWEWKIPRFGPAMRIYRRCGQLWSVCLGYLYIRHSITLPWGKGATLSFPTI